MDAEELDLNKKTNDRLHIHLVQRVVMSLMLEIWEMILGYLVEDAHAVVRLMEAMPELQKNKSLGFWTYLEQSLRYPSEYYLFCRVFQFMGARKRVMSWARYLDAPCDSCHTNMQQVFVPTFPLRTKLCSYCRETHLKSETQLTRCLPYLLFFSFEVRIAVLLAARVARIVHQIFSASRCAEIRRRARIHVE